MYAKFLDFKTFFKSNSTTNHVISESRLTAKKSSNVLINKNNFNCLQNLIPEKNIDNTCENIIEEEDLTLNSFKTESKKSDFKEFKLFLNQNIQIIKGRKNKFLDSRFLTFISSIVEDEESPLYISLASRFKAKNLNELNNLIKWKRIEVRFY